MIYPFRKDLKIEYAYKFSDVLKYGLNELGYTANYPKADTTSFTRNLFTYYGINFPATTLIPQKYLDNDRMGLLNKLIERYWDEYVFTSEEDLLNPLNILTTTDILYKTRRLLGKIIDIIQFTYDKYASILDSYDTAKTKLLDKMNKTISGSDTRRDNDTPQDGGDYSDDNHTSFISQGQVDNEENWDDTPIIERLDKIERLYQQTFRNWLDEFKDLFIDGGNFHEI